MPRNSRFAVAAVKTRLQDFKAIFSFKAAALAVGRRSGSVGASFVLICELAAAVTKNSSNPAASDANSAKARL